jgi:hypothetical protein
MTSSRAALLVVLLAACRASRSDDATITENADAQTDAGASSRDASSADAHTVVPPKASAKPELLATDAPVPDEIGAMTSHGEYLYWVHYTQGAIKRMPLAGGAIERIATAPSALEIVVDDGAIFWLEGGTPAGDYKDGALKRKLHAPKASEGAEITIAKDLIAPYGLAADATSVYWGNDPGPEKGFIASAPRGGGEQAILANGQTAPFSVAVDAQWVYWVNIGWQGNAHAVGRTPIGGTPASQEQLYFGPGRFTSVVVDPAGLTWTNIGSRTLKYIDGSIMRLSFADGSVKTLAENRLAPAKVAIDTTHVYWLDLGSPTNGLDGSLNRVPISGGPLETLAKMQKRPIALWVGPTHAYWQNAADGTIQRITK